MLPLHRVLIAAGIALAIALLALRARSLSRDGAIAAWLVGTLAITAGNAWGWLLVLYFVVASVLSRMGAARRDARTGRIVEKGGARDAWQVMANGFVFAIAAIGQLVAPSLLWLTLGAGALAASAADTWATEIGTLVGGEPRTIVGWRQVPAGTSGAITLAGTLASVAGAAFIAALAWWAGLSDEGAAAVFAGGIVGAFADSVLGATIQERRWCDRCKESTERAVHLCGAPTRVSGGIGGLDNDRVNLLCGVVGGIAGVAIAAWW